MSDSVGKYLIEEVLSSGGSATTYRALEPQLDRHVLLKVLHPSLSKDEKSVERFSREAKAVARIKHPGIVHIYDYGRADGLYYIAMEYVEGLSLAGLLSKQGRLPIAPAAHIAQSCARSLGFAHGQGIVHRDVKPGNIILGYDGAVKISDFGLAYSEKLSSITVDGELFGTPSYMSPEQIKGEKVDARTDVYSLGLTFYEMLSGIQPFKGTNYSAIITKKLTEDVPPLKRVLPDLPPRLLSIVTRMVERTPQKRYQSMEELSADLSRWREESSSTFDDRELASYLADGTRVEPIAVEVPKPVTRRRILIYSAGAFALLVALTLVAVWRREVVPPVSPVAVTPDTTAPVSPAWNQTGAVQVSSTPQGALVFVDSAASPVRTPSLLTGLSPGEHELTAVLEGYGRETQKVLVEPGGTTQASFLFRPTAGTGLVRVNAAPWAVVYVDGDSFDVTPFSRLLRLERGRHELVLTNPDYPDYVANIEVRAGQTTDVYVDFARAWSSSLPPRGAGYARIGVEPWAVVYVDGDSVDTTPFNRLLRLSHGRHKLVLSNPGFPDCFRNLDIREGETTDVFVNIRNEFGYLMVKVEPWADVYVDGEYRDTTPLARPIAVPPGEHSVKLVGPASASWEKKLFFERGKTVEEKVVLPQG